MRGATSHSVNITRNDERDLIEESFRNIGMLNVSSEVKKSIMLARNKGFRFTFQEILT